MFLSQHPAFKVSSGSKRSRRRSSRRSTSSHGGGDGDNALVELAAVGKAGLANGQGGEADTAGDAARSGDAPVLKGHRNRPGGQIIPKTAARAPVPGSDTSSDEAAIRRRVLSTDAALSNLYAQLVATGVVSEEEFWRQRKQALLDEEARRPGAGYSAFVDDADDDERVPKVTLSKVSYTLTEWDIEKIFRESPAVFAAYLQEVPAR